MEKVEGNGGGLPSDPVPLTEREKTLIWDVALDTEENLNHNYYPGFGIFPSAKPRDNFYNQVYARDSAHAIGNYFADKNPAAVRDSLATLLRYQRSDGALPLRVEREHQMVKLTPGLRRLSRPIFAITERALRGRSERPVYEGGDFGASGSEDTVPVTLIAAGEFFIASAEGRAFVKEHFESLKRAAAFFEAKTDPEDGLAIIQRQNPDWADSLHRTGKLGGMNVWWARALRLMEFMARELGYAEDAERYQAMFRMAKKSVLEKIYNAEGGYFRAKEGEERIDTVASIFGALYLLPPAEAVKVEETLKSKVLRKSGLQNFHPHYSGQEFSKGHRMWGRAARIAGAFSKKPKPGLDVYHNQFVWPWVTCQNIQVKIKIAREHGDPIVRNQYKKEAIDDLVHMGELFTQAGGAYEVVDPDEPKPADIFAYTPPKNFMGSMAAYQGAFRQLKELGWI